MKRTAIKKILMFCSLGLACVIAGWGVAGCSAEFLPEFESEYFRYAVYTWEDGTQEAYLIGFTQLGAEQTHLVIPDEMGGIPVVGFGYERRIGMWNSQIVCDFKNEKTERFYIPFNIDRWRNLHYHGIQCPDCSVVLWYDVDIWRHPCMNRIIGYNLFADYLKENKNADRPVCNNGSPVYDKLANVSFMYNYGEAENGGYYWVDSYDSENIKFIPPEPVREGYTFCGWFKEPECINAWDFQKDKTKAEMEITSTDIGSYNTENITFLYAKWEKSVAQ